MSPEDNILEALGRAQREFLAISRIADTGTLPARMQAAMRIPDMAKLAASMQTAARMPDTAKWAANLQAAMRIPDMANLAASMQAAMRMSDITRLTANMRAATRMPNIAHLLASLENDLQGFSPAIQVADGSLVIDGQGYDAEQIRDQYILGDEGLLFCDADEFTGLWQRMPLAVRWIVWFLLTFYLAPFYNAATENTPFHPDKLARQVVESINRLRRQLLTSDSTHHAPCFVKRWETKAYLRPKRKSEVLGRLYLLQGVSILRYRNRKRWVLIEWEPEDGRKYRGWVLGRHICR
ncbi:MAG: hypothetical protein ACYC6Y_06530 [Thermoguttaceae bacterium]